MGKQWKQWRDVIFWGSRITADDDCSQEIKRHLLLGRIAMTNLDSVLKSKDITLSTKVCIVKAIVFPVVMYRCESWIIKKSEHRRIDAFKLWRLEKTLESPLDSKKIKPVNPKKKNQSWIFIGRTDEAEILDFGHLIQRSNSLEKTCWERLRTWEGGDRGWDGWMVSPTQWMWVWTNSGR